MLTHRKYPGDLPIPVRWNYVHKTAFMVVIPGNDDPIIDGFHSRLFDGVIVRSHWWVDQSITGLIWDDPREIAFYTESLNRQEGGDSNNWDAIPDYVRRNGGLRAFQYNPPVPLDDPRHPCYVGK